MLFSTDEFDFQAAVVKIMVPCYTNGIIWTLTDRHSLMKKKTDLNAECSPHQQYENANLLKIVKV